MVNFKKFTKKRKKKFFKTTVRIDKPELDAATENANNKNEKIIIDILDPTLGLFVDGKLNLYDQFENPNNIDNTYKLPNQLNKRLDGMLKENRPPEFFEPKPIAKIPNNVNTQESDNILINDIYINENDISAMIIQDVPKFEPDIDF